jgi:hypothetical protein
MTDLEALSFHRHCEEQSDEANQSNRLVDDVDVFDMAGDFLKIIMRYDYRNRAMGMAIIFEWVRYHKLSAHCALRFVSYLVSCSLIHFWCQQCPVLFLLIQSLMRSI